MNKMWSILLTLLASVSYGQVVTLTDSNQSVTVGLASAPATTQPTYLVTWRGIGGPVDAVGSTTGSTAVTMLSGTTQDGPKHIESVQVYNRDTASVTATVRKVVSGTAYPLVSATIPVGGTLVWTKEQGIRVLDSGGSNATATVGAVAGTGVTVAETGHGSYRTTTFTLTNMPMTIRDTTSPAQGGGQKIYDFPEGRIFILGATGTATVTTTSAIASTLNSGVSCRWGVGSVTQANATLATTEQDILPVTTFTSGTTINVANAATTSALAAAAQFNGTTTALDAFFNISVPTATDIDADATVAVNATITINWVFLGDL